MTFNDIFKSSFLENITSVSILDMVVALVLAFCLGLFIFFIYKKTYIGVMYSSSFGVTLVALTMITTLVILAVTSNVVLSLGMVGALSIVRFRAAIKEPFEIVFLFWALAVGIVVGAGMFLLAVVGSLIIGVFLVLFAQKKIGIHPYILVVSCTDSSAETAVMETVRSAVARLQVKAKTVSAHGTEISIEVTLKNEETAFVSALCAIDGVSTASLVTYNGQFAD
jgi:uncharacterized membrane protein YhiD involved in acid resistance